MKRCISIFFRILNVILFFPTALVAGILFFITASILFALEEMFYDWGAKTKRESEW